MMRYSDYQLVTCLMALALCGPAHGEKDRSILDFTFKNWGSVDRTMVISERDRECYYVESPTEWSVPWGNHSGGAFYPYLYRMYQPVMHVGPKRPDVVIENFESGRYDGWTVEGTAFQAKPSRTGSIFHHQPMSGYEGRYLADSFLDSRDDAKGKLTSKPFTIKRNYITFLIGGGNHFERTCMNLKVDGVVVRTAQGRNREVLEQTHWDVCDLQGKQAAIEIVDDESGGWGHVMVDRIVLSDTLPPEWIAPPLGLRSAVPLGGLGAGTVELRADGSFHDWNIFNNSPAGAGKIQLDDVFFFVWMNGAKSGTHSWVLRTHPPHGLPAIERIEYSGAYPVSGLRFSDTALPLNIAMAAYSAFVPRDPERSAAPAIFFTFDIGNPSREPIELSLGFTMPNAIEGKLNCERGISLIREGDGPLGGGITVRTVRPSYPLTSAVYDDPHALWDDLHNDGELSGERSGGGSKQGATVARMTLNPFESKRVTFAMAWYFPHRPHGTEVLGNHYAKQYKSADDVLENLLPRLDDITAAIIRWQRFCFDNSLPDSVQDSLVNSAATMAKTGMWFADGRWRQWESFSCPAVDPVHIHYYRSLPYVWLFPALQQNLYRGYASAQLDDGYIQENLGFGGNPLDVPSGRMMGDGCTCFLLGIYSNYLWTDDREFLDTIWPSAKKAAQWQMDRSQQFGLPHHLNNTYDWWEFENKDVVSYNAFLHLAALRAAERLARVQGDDAFAEQCLLSEESGRKALIEKLWTGRYFRSWWNADGEYPDAMHADTLYGQLWSSVLGLGWLVDVEMIRSHLDCENEMSLNPYGLLVMRGDDDNAVKNNLVWEAGSLDWAALNVYAGGDVTTSYAMADRILQKWRNSLRDPWDYKDLTTGWDGHPFCNSHYGRQVILWALPLALSGQEYSAPERILTFKPAVTTTCILPYITPDAFGSLYIYGDGQFGITVISGTLDVDRIEVHGEQVRSAGPCRLITGDSLMLHE